MNANWFRIIGGFGAGMLITIFYFNQPQNSGEWASWVQAFGSIGAILAAIWVLNQQNAHAIERADLEVTQIVLSFRDEVFTLLTGFRQLNKEKLMANPLGPYIERIPASEGAFVIYNTSAGQIGKIQDHELRAQIVVTYARAYGFIRSLQLNNELVTEYQTARVDAQRDPAVYSTHRDEKLAQLTDYGPKLRYLFTSLEIEADKFITLIKD